MHLSRCLGVDTRHGSPGRTLEALDLHIHVQAVVVKGEQCKQHSFGLNLGLGVSWRGLHTVRVMEQSPTTSPLQSYPRRGSDAGASTQPKA